MLAVQTIDNMRHMLIILIIFQLLQNLTHLLTGEGPVIENTLLFELRTNGVIHFLWNLRAFLGLELREPLIEMVNTLIGVIAPEEGPYNSAYPSRPKQTADIRTLYM